MQYPEWVSPWRGEREWTGGCQGWGWGEEAGEEEVGSDCLVGTGFYSGVMMEMFSKRSDGCPTLCMYQMPVNRALDSGV